ncbi:MAG: hypothetical protein QG632_213 [Candidatus Dependentiae bacterium]|nr:hypothetical protein [Candidatus Dependentiae bacterium]
MTHGHLLSIPKLRTTPQTAQQKLKKEESQFKSVQARLRSLITKLSKPDGAIFEDQSADQKEYETLSAKIKAEYEDARKAGSKIPEPTVEGWGQFSRKLKWKTDAERDATEVAALNKKLSQIARRIKGKALTPKLKQQSESTVNSLVAKIQSPDLNGKPIITWREIEPTLKDPKVEAQRFYTKAIKIKIALTTKSFFQAEHEKLIDVYTTNRKLALKYDPDLTSQLPEANSLTIQPIKANTSASEKRLLKGYVSKLNSINKLLSGGFFGRGGVTQEEADKQIALFKSTTEQATKQYAILVEKYKDRPSPLPALTTKIKIVGPEKAAEKYVTAIKKIDTKLTRQTFMTKLKGLSERERIKLITQRDALEKKVEALGPNATKLLPEKPRQAYTNPLEAPDSAPTTIENTTTGKINKDESKKKKADTETDSKEPIKDLKDKTTKSKDDEDKEESIKDAKKSSSSDKGKDQDDDVPASSVGKVSSSSKSENATNIVINMGDKTPAATGPATSMPEEKKPGFFTRMVTPSPMGMGGMGPMGGMGMMGMGGMMGGGMMAPGMMPGMMPQAAAGPTIINNISSAPAAAAGVGAVVGSGTPESFSSNPSTNTTSAGASPSKSDFPDLTQPIEGLTSLKVTTIQNFITDLALVLTPESATAYAQGLTAPRPKQTARPALVQSWKRARRMQTTQMAPGIAVGVG